MSKVQEPITMVRLTSTRKRKEMWFSFAGFIHAVAGMNNFGTVDMVEFRAMLSVYFRWSLNLFASPAIILATAKTANIFILRRNSNMDAELYYWFRTL